MEYNDRLSEAAETTELESSAVPRTPWQKILSATTRMPDWFNRYGPLMTALAMVTLAVITFLYLQETRAQRRLTYTQLGLVHAPEVHFSTPTPFEYGESMRTGISLSNGGGQVEETQYAFVLLCCEVLEDLVSKPEEAKTLVRLGRLPRLGSHRTITIARGITGDERTLFEGAAKKPGGLYAFAQVTYTKPPLQFGDKPLTVTDSISFWWHAKLKRWMECGAEWHESIKSIVAAKGALKETPQR